MRRYAVCVFFLAGTFPWAQQGRVTSSLSGPCDVSALSGVLVLSTGRLKLACTQARELVRLGKLPAPEGVSPLGIYWQSIFEPEKVLSMAFLRPREPAEREVFGEDPISPREVLDFWDSQVENFRQAQAAGRQDHAPSAQRMQQLWRSVSRLWETASELSELRHFLFLPDPRSLQGAFLTYAQAKEAVSGGVPELSEAVLAFEKLREAYRRGAGASFEKEAEALKKAQRALCADLRERLEAAELAVPSAFAAAVEYAHGAVDERIPGLVLFALSMLLFASRWILRGAFLRRAAWAVLGAGIVWNVWIVGARTVVAHRLPLKNLNEVYLVVLFFVPAIGALLAVLLKQSAYAAIGAALSTVAFVGSLFLPARGYVITPPVAILRSPWREVHILSIMLSYAVLLVAAGLHTGFLITRRRSSQAQGTRNVSEELFRNGSVTLAWGFLFLTIGIATGAAWARASWGRYWGWDPKEVWATVAWAIYAIFLHLRIFFRTRKEILAAVSLLGFAAVLFTYFGVSYLLPGLHSYA